MWQTKCYEIEQNLDTVTEQSQEQEIKIENLQKHCNELTALLDDYRKKTIITDDSNISTISSSSYDGNLDNVVDLAQSVVEVQLRELQTVNEDLLEKLQIIEEELELKVCFHIRCSLSGPPSFILL